jgi:chromosome segregation ATPase
MIAEVCDALKSAGADEDKARAAATAIAGQWDIEPRFDQIDRRFDQIDQRIDKVEGRLDRLENRFDRLEQRVSRIETDVGIIKWMLGFTLAFQVATLFFVWQTLLRLPA